MDDTKTQSNPNPTDSMSANGTVGSSEEGAWGTPRECVPLSKFRARTVATTDGGHLYAMEAGDSQAPSILFVHGYPDTHHVWLPVMQRLASDFHVVAYDVRGAGDSFRPSEPSAYDLEQLVRDMHAVRRELCGEKPVHLVGHDWGGIQSWEAVCENDASEAFESFAVFSGPCLDHAAVWMREQFRAGGEARKQVLAQAAKSTYLAALVLPVIPRLMWSSGLAKLWRREVDPSSPRYRNLEDDGAFGANLYRQNMIERHQNPRTRETNVRTLIVGLDEDSYVSPAVMKSGLSHADPGFFVRMPFDHWSLFEAPDQLATFIADWVDQAAPPVVPDR